MGSPLMKPVSWDGIPAVSRGSLVVICEPQSAESSETPQHSARDEQINFTAAALEPRNPNTHRTLNLITKIFTHFNMYECGRLNEQTCA